MYRTANQTTSARRRIGVLVFTGAAAGLVTFAVAAGSAAASPDAPFVPNLPSLNADAVALNPQPLPPGPDFSRVALNPRCRRAPIGCACCCHGWDSDERSGCFARTGRSHVDSAAAESS